jgi:hypothetical protein
LPIAIALAFAALMVITRPWTLLPPRATVPAAPAPAPGPSPAELLVRLRTALHGEAKWEREGIGQPPEWRGTLKEGESLVHWNARVSAAIEGTGLKVRNGREELLERGPGVTMQRLTLEVGTAEAVLASVVVETRRSPYLPPTF